MGQNCTKPQQNTPKWKCTKPVPRLLHTDSIQHEYDMIQVAYVINRVWLNYKIYHQTPNKSCTLVGNRIVHRCSNFIFIFDLTSGLNGLGKDKCKTRRERVKFWGIGVPYYRGLTVGKYLHLQPFCQTDIEDQDWIKYSIPQKTMDLITSHNLCWTMLMGISYWGWG